MSAVVRTLAELARVVEEVVAQWLAGRPSTWSVETPEPSGRGVAFRVRCGDGGFRLRVEPTGSPGPAAVTGRSLRVLALSPPSDPRAFETLARAIAALDVAVALHVEPAIEVDAIARPERDREAVPKPHRGAEGTGQLFNPERTERRFHLVNLGLPRTGTTTLAAMFGKWRSGHEHWIQPMMKVLSARSVGAATDDDVLALLRAREDAGRLEVDSASFLFLAADQLIRLYPHAKYVMTWRQCETWIGSFLGVVQREGGEPPASHWRVGCDPAWFSSDAAFQRALPELVVHAVQCWVDGMTRTLDVMPAGGLVLPMEELGSAGPALARFVGIPESTIVSRHENVSRGIAWREAVPPSLHAHVAERVAPVLARVRSR